jgi:hypothetical protein
MCYESLTNPKHSILKTTWNKIMATANQQQIKEKLYALKFDDKTIKDIIKEQKSNNFDLTPELSERIKFYHNHIRHIIHPLSNLMKEADNIALLQKEGIIGKSNRKWKNSVSYLYFAGDFANQLFNSTKADNYDDLVNLIQQNTIITKFIEIQTIALNSSKYDIIKENATHVLVMLYKTLNINQLEDFQKQVVLYVMDNVNSNPHQWKNVLSVINFFLSSDTRKSNFMSKHFKNENGGLNTEKIMQYAKLYNNYSIHAQKKMKQLDKIVLDGYTQVYEKILFETRDNENQTYYINDLNIFNDSYLIDYLILDDLNFVKELVKRNKNINLNQRVLSIIPILQKGHELCKLSLVDIANSFIQNDNFISMIFNPDKTNPNNYLNYFKNKIINKMKVNLDAVSLFSNMNNRSLYLLHVLMKYTKETAKSLYTFQDFELVKNFDEIDFFKQLIGKFKLDENGDNFNLITDAILYYSVNVKRGDYVKHNTDLRQMILKQVDENRQFDSEQLKKVYQTYKKIDQKISNNNKTLAERQEEIEKAKLVKEKISQTLIFLDELG